MSTVTHVANVKLTRKPGFHYFINGAGDIVEMDRKTKERKTVHTHTFTPEKGFIYFLTPNGIGKSPRVPRKKKELEVTAEPVAQ